MKITRMIVTALATAIMAMIGVTDAPIASAANPMVGKLGSELTMTDSVGQVVLSWKVERPQTQHRRDAGLPRSWQGSGKPPPPSRPSGAVLPPPFRSSTPSPPTKPPTGCCGKSPARPISAAPPSSKAHNRPAKSTST